MWEFLFELMEWPYFLKDYQMKNIDFLKFDILSKSHFHFHAGSQSHRNAYLNHFHYLLHHFSLFLCLVLLEHWILFNFLSQMDQQLSSTQLQLFLEPHSVFKALSEDLISFFHFTAHWVLKFSQLSLKLKHSSFNGAFKFI